MQHFNGIHYSKFREQKLRIAMIMRVAALPRPPDARVLFPVEDSRRLYFQRDFFAHDICMGRTILSV